MAGRLARRATVLELHDVVGPGLPAAAQSLIVAASSAAVSISSVVSARVRRPGRGKVQLIGQAVDLDTFTPGTAEPAWRLAMPASFVVGIVGRVDRSKGVDVLIRAAAQAGAGVIVAGKPSMDDDGYLDEVLTLGKTLLGADFRYAGPVSLDAVPGLLRSLDAVVNASVEEPFGLSILEAMACGIPVVATDSGGVRDFVRDGEHGLLVPPKDVPALAAALRRLREDPALRAGLAGVALALVRAEYGIATRARRLAALYRSLAR